LLFKEKLEKYIRHKVSRWNSVTSI
jgi:hypothetical protein